VTSGSFLRIWNTGCGWLRAVSSDFTAAVIGRGSMPARPLNAARSGCVAISLCGDSVTKQPCRDRRACAGGNTVDDRHDDLVAADAERAAVERGFRPTISTTGPADGCYARALSRETACCWRYACVVLTTRVRPATSREVRGRPVHRATEIARKRDGRSVRDSAASRDTSGRPGSCQPPPLDSDYRSREVSLRSMKITRCGSLHKCRAYSSMLVETVRRCSPNAFS
jgi:hypothetical protein